MGIILLTELGITPWQLRLSLFLPLLVVWPLMPATSALVMDLALPTMDMEPPAMKPEAPRDSEDSMAAMELARGLLMPAMLLDPPLPTMDMEPPAMNTEAPRDSEDSMATMELARGLLNLLTTLEELLPLSMSTVPSTPMDMESTMLERDQLSPHTLVDMPMDLAEASSMFPDLSLDTESACTTVRVSRMLLST